MTRAEYEEKEMMIRTDIRLAMQHIRNATYQMTEIGQVRDGTELQRMRRELELMLLAYARAEIPTSD